MITIEELKKHIKKQSKLVEKEIDTPNCDRDFLFYYSGILSAYELLLKKMESLE